MRPRAWSPKFGEAFRLSLRPILLYLAFNVLGFGAFFVGVVFYGNESELGLLVASCLAGLIGIFAGQLISLMRVRLWPIFILTFVCALMGGWLIATVHDSSDKDIVVPFFFFLFALPCGMLSLQHRFELFSLFWPGVGWIGGVMIILNDQDRVTQWRENKLSAWLPIPLLFLACFIAFMVAFFAVKQTQRVRLWEALSGALERRIEKKEPPRVARKNTLPIIAVIVVLFVFTAVLSPFLWRTGRGDHSGKHEGKPDEYGQQHEKQKPESGEDPHDGPKVDAETVSQMLKKMGQSAKHNAQYLLPLLLLLLFYRPLKRAFVVSHLKAPIFPTSPSEKIENLWEYVRIVAEDAGIVPKSNDSVEDLVKRVAERGAVPDDLSVAAQIYARSRYGYALAPGDGREMKKHAFAAARALSSGIDGWTRIRVWWRALR